MEPTPTHTSQSFSEQFLGLWSQAYEIWIAGGWAMIAIAFVALVMFSVGVHVHLRLGAKRFTRVRESTWRRWVAQPGEATGPVGQMIASVMKCGTLPEMSAVFTELRADEAAPFERDLKVMKVCVGAAPLFGLLGTVTGMLTTFGALASGSGGDKTMGMIAAGISEALITTETGLVIALPGLFMQYQLSRKFNRYSVFLSHMETVCTQFLYRKLREARTMKTAA